MTECSEVASHAGADEEACASADGLTQAEATKRQAQYGPTRSRKRRQRIPEVPLLLLGSDSVDDGSRRDPLRRCPSLFDFFVILRCFLSNAWLDFGKSIRRECHAASKPFSDQAKQGKEVQVGRIPKRGEFGPRRRHPSTAGRHRSTDTRLLDGDPLQVISQHVTQAILPSSAKPAGPCTPAPSSAG